MNFRQIETLLEQYFDGDTSLEDEKVLREFFKGDDIPPHLLSLKAQFEFYSTEEEKEYLDESFDNKILELIENEKITSTRSIRRQYIYVISGIAASILIIISIFTKFDGLTNKIEDSFDNPEMAYEETKKALLFVSQKFNKGLKPVGNVQKFSEGIQPLEKMSGLNAAQQNVLKLAKFEEVRSQILKN